MSVDAVSAGPLGGTGARYRQLAVGAPNFAGVLQQGDASNVVPCVGVELGPGSGCARVAHRTVHAPTWNELEIGGSLH
eukprot:353950-Chlamydomonas_euryale.AAC.8